MSSSTPEQRSQAAAVWRPTQAFLRAAVLAVSLLVAALVFQDASFAVLAAPFLVVTAWSVTTKPSTSPGFRHPRALPTLREGEGMRWQAHVDAVPGLDQAALLFERVHYQELRPGTGALTIAADLRSAAPVELTVDARSTRWGNQQVGRSLISATSSWAAFRWGPVTIDGVPQVTLPLPAVFDAAAPTPHPVGLVGLNRAARRGEGSEFATIRPFMLGDRLRRIHWPVSLRTGSLHVASTWADQDAEVMLLVDASTDLGTSQGIEGYASSLDVTVRAAGAVAEHFLRHGERVGMCIFGPDVVRLPPAAGVNHLRKLLLLLSDTKVGNRSVAEGKLLRLRLGADSIVIMLSACTSELALRQAIVTAGRGLTVIVVDTLPEHIGGIADPALTVAWRIRRLERGAEIRQLNRAGIPVVPWRGPGSLDQVLQDLGRRSSAPRVAHR